MCSTFSSDIIYIRIRFISTTLLLLVEICTDLSMGSAWTLHIYHYIALLTVDIVRQWTKQQWFAVSGTLMVLSFLKEFILERSDTEMIEI